jgi:HTH-type transcriptional regulator, competence development regulator
MSTMVLLATVGNDVTARLGRTLRQVREVRRLTAVEAARAAGISPAYLSKLENDAVKKPSPQVLHSLSRALDIPYADLMRLCDYRVPGEPDAGDARPISFQLFADLTEDEADELLEYLAWYRTRQRSRRGGGAEPIAPAGDLEAAGAPSA